MSEQDIWWSPQIEAIARELSKLAIACDIDFFDDSVAEKILRNDTSVCGRSNPKAFRLIREHLMALYEVEEGAIERLGPTEVKETLDQVRAAIRALRTAGHSRGGE